MLKLYPEQLHIQLNEKLNAVYLLFGNDPFLLQESQNAILRIAVTHGFKEHHTFQIENSTDWQIIFSICQTMSLFSTRQIIQISLPENGTNTAINDQLTILVNLLHSDLLLIIRGNKLTKMQENTYWFNQLYSHAVMVICQTPEQENLLRWVVARAKHLHLHLDEASCQLLCYCYEGNLLALTQTLEQLAILWPDGKLTLSHIEQVVNDAAYFIPTHWVNAVLQAKSERSLHILKHLRLEGSEPVILLRTLQHELLLLLTLKRQQVHIPLRTLFDKHRVWKNRQIVITEAMNRLSQDQLRKAIQLMTHTELALKHNYSQSVWSRLEAISLLLCNELLADVFISD